MTSKCKHWCFTYNNYTDDGIAVLHKAFDDGKLTYLLYGKESGENNTPHLQGFLSLRTKANLTTLRNLLGPHHYESARAIKEAIVYCKKDNDYTELGIPPTGQGSRNELEDFKAKVKDGCFNHVVLRDEFSKVWAKYPMFCKQYIEDNVPKQTPEMYPLRPWQASLYQELALTPDNRQITFVVDRTGNTGKSWFARYYTHLHDNSQMLLPGKKADMAYVLRSDVRVIFLDCPRSKQGEYIQYDFLEEIKNGYVFNSKYESYYKRLPPIHLIVFMNEQPDMTKLSADRYKLIIL